MINVRNIMTRWQLSRIFETNKEIFNETSAGFDYDVTYHIQKNQHNSKYFSYTEFSDFHKPAYNIE